MRTTLSLDDNLMRAAKRRAAETGQTLSSVIETALRETLEQEKKTKHSFRLRWITVKGGVQPGVDLVDRDALIERMEGRS
jgi:metal-responsive CopG/Arc/MetJ family transcriptional regulator